MELDRQSNFQDDRRSAFRSFGSNNHPCSQSRKASIGVTVDKTAKLRSGEEKESALSKTEQITSNRGKLAEDKNKSAMLTAVKRKQAADPLQEVSPWISNRSLHQEIPAKPVNSYARCTSVSCSANGTQKNLSGTNLFANQTSISHPVNGVEKKLDSVTHGRALGKDGTTGRVEESAFTAALEVCVPDEGTVKGETDKTAKRSNEDLRMKLWEILGRSPSPNGQNPDTPARTPEVDTENLNPVRHLNQKSMNVVKPEHNSDTRQMLGSNPLPIEKIPVFQFHTEMGRKNLKSVGHLDQNSKKAVKLRSLSDEIETDTQSPHQTNRRPVTRSSTRKKAPVAVQLKLQHKANNGGHAPPSLSHRGKYQKNTLSFDDTEGWSTSLCGTLDGSSSMLRRKKNDRKSSTLAPRTIYRSKNKKDNPDMILQVIDRRKTRVPAKWMISDGRSEGSPELSPQAVGKNLRAAYMRKTPPPAEKDMNLPANDRRTPSGSERMMPNGRIEGSEVLPSESHRDTFRGTDRRKTPPPVRSMVFHSDRMDAPHNNLEDKTECLQRTDGTMAPPAKRSVPCTNGMESSHGCPPQNNRDYLQPKSGILDDHLHFPPTRKKTNQQEKINSSPSPKNAPRTKNERKGGRFAPRMIYLSQNKKDNPDMILQVIDRRKTPVPAKWMISDGRIEGSPVLSMQAVGKNLRAAYMRKTPPPAEKDMNLPANDRRTPSGPERMMSNGRIEGSEVHPSESRRDTLRGTDRRKTPPPVRSLVFHSDRLDASHSHVENKTECLPSTDGTTAPLAERPVPCTNGMESSHGCPPQNNRDYPQPKSGILDDHLHFPPTRKKTNQQEKINSPPSQKNAQHQEGLRSPSSKKNDPEDGSQISMFGIKHQLNKHRLSRSSPAREPMRPDACISAPAGRKSMVEDFCGLRSLMASKRDSFALHEQPESSHDAGELKKSSIRGLFPAMGENGAECQLSQSSSEEGDAARLEEDLPISKGTGRPEKPPVMLRPNKRLREQEEIKNCEISPSSSPPKGTEENNGVPRPSDQNYEDGLERTVALFALSLERFKSKVKSQTSKKCSQILASVAERIQLQLQNVESQILADVGEFTSLGKSKRKRLETRFQEQEERLKVIQDKFKEEVNKHLQDCTSTLEELEAFEMGLKGAAEKQKASHRKLLLQVEEEMVAQLGEAERRITTIHKVARDKMLQLKHVINESSKGGFN